MTRCPNSCHRMHRKRQPRYVLTIRCGTCRECISLGKANDRIPRREWRLNAFHQARGPRTTAGPPCPEMVPRAGLEPALSGF